MSDDQQFAIPQSVREMAERNVEQARQAYAQFMDVARQAQGMVTKSHEAAAESALDVQSRAIGFAEANIEAGFKFARDLAKAGDLQEALALQQDFARQQMQSYTEQTQELSQLLGEAAQKAPKPGQ